MREPPRLREDGQDLLAATLLDAARAYRRPHSTRSRILRSLGLPIALSVSTPISAAVASSLAAKAIVVASLVTIAAGGGTIAYQLHARSETRRAHVSTASRKLATSITRPQVVQAPTVAVAAAVEGGPRTDPAPQVSAQAVPAAIGPLALPTGAASRSRARRPVPERPLSAQPVLAPRDEPTTSPVPPTLPPPSPFHAAPAAAPAPVVTPPSFDRRERTVAQIPFSPPPAVSPAARAPLARELTLLEAAQRAVRRHDHRAALSSLDEYTRSFPDGALLAEAQVLRIAALLGSGDETAAREQARLFLSRYAPSPLAARVRSMLSDPSRQTKELP